MRKLNKMQDNNKICISQEEFENNTKTNSKNNGNIYDVFLANPFQNVIMTQNLNITQDGEYFVVFLACPTQFQDQKKSNGNNLSFRVDKSKPYLSLKGYIEFKNPNGFLSADKVLDMRFYLIMSFVYIGFLFFWAFKLFQKVQYLINFHYVISAVFIIAFFESWVIYINYSLYNIYGRKSAFPFYLATLLSV